MMSQEKITSLLQEKFHPVYLNVVDESHKHAGHNLQAVAGGTHFNVHIVSTVFEGRKLIERHRLVYAAIGEEVGNQVHALAVIAKTPLEHNC